MRLSEQQITIIQANALTYFGQTSHVWLFGSRTDDKQAGGDIDLYIESDIQTPTELIDAKLHFLSAVHRKLGEQKIDVIIHQKNSQNTALYQRIKKQGIQLV